MISRLALITQSAPWPQNPYHGAFNISQTKALRAIGVETEIFAPMIALPPLLKHFSTSFKQLAGRPRDYVYDGVPIHVTRGPYPHPVFLRWYVTPRMPRLVASWVDRAIRRRMEARLRAFKPDAILVHDGLILGRLARSLAQRLGVPWSVIEHDPIDLDPASRIGRFYADQMRDARAIITVHRPTESHLREKLKLPQAKLILNGTLVPTQAQWDTPRPPRWAGKKVILSVGSYIERKGRAELVRAFNEANVPDSLLVLLGPGSPPPNVQQLIDQAGPQRIEVIGAMAPQEVQQYMVWADLFALPSWWEAFGLVYLEAMAAAAPVILTSDSGMAMELEHGKHGWIVPPRDHAALVTALREALTTADLESMGQAGQQLIAERFSWDRNARELIAAIDQTRPAHPQGR